MPQVKLCKYCQEPIDERDDEFVLLNPEARGDYDKPLPEALWIYAHVRCHVQD